MTTADIIPPNFTGGTPLASQIHETDFTVVVQLNKSSCTVFYSVLLASTAQPSLLSVLAGTAPGSLYNGTINAPTVSHSSLSLAGHLALPQPVHVDFDISEHVSDMAIN